MTAAPEAKGSLRVMPRRAKQAGHLGALNPLLAAPGAAKGSGHRAPRQAWGLETEMPRAWGGISKNGKKTRGPGSFLEVFGNAIS